MKVALILSPRGGTTQTTTFQSKHGGRTDHNHPRQRYRAWPQGLRFETPGKPGLSHPCQFEQGTLCHLSEVREDQNNQEYRRRNASERRKVHPARRWEDQHDARRSRRQRQSCRVLRYRRQEGNREDFAGLARGAAEAPAENRRKKTKGGCAERIRAVADSGTEPSPPF